MKETELALSAPGKHRADHRVTRTPYIYILCYSERHIDVSTSLTCDERRVYALFDRVLLVSVVLCRHNRCTACINTSSTTFEGSRRTQHFPSASAALFSHMRVFFLGQGSVLLFGVVRGCSKGVHLRCLTRDKIGFSHRQYQAVRADAHRNRSIFCAVFRAIQMCQQFSRFLSRALIA